MRFSADDVLLVLYDALIAARRQRDQALKARDEARAALREAIACHLPGCIDPDVCSNLTKWRRALGVSA